MLQQSHNQLCWRQLTKSKTIRTATSPQSTVKRMSDSFCRVAWSKSALICWQQVGGLQVVHELSWQTTRHSVSFDNMGAIEIGRYDETSVVSMPGFFTVGVMNAFLKPVGKWPGTSKRLNTSVMNGARRSTLPCEFRKLSAAWLCDVCRSAGGREVAVSGWQSASGISLHKHRVVGLWCCSQSVTGHCVDL